MTGSTSFHDSRGGATAPDAVSHGPYAPQRARRNRGRTVSPDPLMFRSTIWLEHYQEASARAHEEPIEQLRDRVCTMEYNLETLRTRLTQFAGLRDAQGIREDHRALVTRLTEVEECASMHTLREFMSQIHRLESMLSGEHGGVMGEAIRACNRRLDNHQATMDDFYARISTQDWYHDLSDQEENEENRLSTRDANANAENQSGMENRPPGRRRTRGQAPQRRFQRTMPRPPPPPPLTQGLEESTAFTPEVIQQAMQRLFAAYNQCVARVAHADDRLEQFRSTIRRDALDLALCVQRNSQDIQHQEHNVEQIRRTLFDEVQVKVNTLDDRIRLVGDQLDGVARTIDRNTHSQCASIDALISEQKDIRQLVEGLARLLDQHQATSGTMSGDASAAMQLEITDLKTKVLRLTEQNTQQDGRPTLRASMSEQVNLMENQIIKWRY